jgi:hypothetical protein
MWVAFAILVRNDGRETDRPFSVAKLRDERGRLFETATPTELPYEAAREAQRLLDAKSDVTRVQPGLTETVLWVYRVPETVQRLEIMPAETTRCSAQ